MPRSRSPPHHRRSKSPKGHKHRSKSPKHRSKSPKHHHKKHHKKPHEAVTGPGNYDDLHWDDLPSKAMRKAKMLGYNERRWDEDRPVPLFRKKPFTELSKQEKKACVFLGMDIYAEHRDLNRHWDDLDDEIKEQATKLGYDKHLWDHDEEPEADDLSWDELTDDQKDAAKFFGYGRNAWNEFTGGEGSPADSDDDAAEEDEAEWVAMEKEEAVKAEEISNEQEIQEDAPDPPAPEPVEPASEPVIAAVQAAPVMAAAEPEEEVAEEVEKPKFFMTRLYGGEGGSAFDHMNRRRISKVTIRGGKWIDGVTFEYGNGDKLSNGGDGGGPESMDLAEDEYINMIRLKEGKIIQSLTFFTNKGNKLGPVGSGKGGIFSKEGTAVEVKAPEGYRLIGIRGREGNYLDAIGFRWGPVPARFN